MFTNILLNNSIRNLFFASFVFFNPSLVNTPTPKVENIETQIILRKPATELISITDSIVTPVLYTGVPEGNLATNLEQREQFINLMLPAILLAKHKIAIDLEKAEAIIKRSENGGKMRWDDFKTISSLYLRYNASNMNELRKKMQTHPTSIVLAQAALESGWGTSRFFRNGFNPFGMWSINPNEARMLSYEKRTDNYIIYMRKYETLGQSIADYFATISRVSVYNKFREANLEGKSVYEMVTYLDKYSELGEYYCGMVNSVIKNFDLLKYDNYRLPDDFTKSKTTTIEL